MAIWMESAGDSAPSRSGLNNSHEWETSEARASEARARRERGASEARARRERAGGNESHFRSFALVRSFARSLVCGKIAEDGRS